MSNNPIDQTKTVDVPDLFGISDKLISEGKEKLYLKTDGDLNLDLSLGGLREFVGGGRKVVRGGRGVEDDRVGFVGGREVGGGGGHEVEVGEGHEVGFIGGHEVGFDEGHEVVIPGCVNMPLQALFPIEHTTHMKKYLMELGNIEEATTKISSGLGNHKSCLDSLYSDVLVAKSKVFDLICRRQMLHDLLAKEVEALKNVEKVILDGVLVFKYLQQAGNGSPNTYYVPINCPDFQAIKDSSLTTNCTMLAYSD